jgi:hypothetical protein
VKPSAPAAAGPLSVAPANDEGEVICYAAELMILIVAWRSSGQATVGRVLPAQSSTRSQDAPQVWSANGKARG